MIIFDPVDSKKLSDTQLYALLRDEDLTAEIAEVVRKEFEDRNFSVQQLDALSLNWEQSMSPKNEKPLKPWVKVLIVLFPFFIPIHALIANLHIYKGEKRKWKNHWQLLVWSYALWIAVLIILSSTGLFKF